MAFAGVNCQNEVDELALINWRATRLAGVLGTLDFGGPFPRQGAIGSGDVLMGTIRLVAAALSGMTSAALVSANPRRGDGDAAVAGQTLSKRWARWRKLPRTSTLIAPSATSCA